MIYFFINITLINIYFLL